MTNNKIQYAYSNNLLINKQKQFMKKLLLLFAAVLAITANAQTVAKTIEVTTPGTLATLLGDDASSITDLTIKGKINSNDINSGLAKASAVTNLDMANAQIVDADGNDTGVLPNYSMSFNKVLKRMVLPKTLKTIGTNAFYKDQALEEIVASEGLTKINQNAFMSCYALKSFNFPSTLETIGRSAFYKTAIESLNAIAALTSIGETAFYGSALKSVDLGANVATISNAAFAGCLNLAKFTVAAANGKFKTVDGVIFDADVTKLYAYPQADPRTEYTTPNTVKEIANSAFDCAARLKTLRISEGVEAIPNSMCYGDTVLTKLYLPSTVKTIDVGAFDACSQLSEFHIRAVTPPVAQTGAFGVMFPNYKMNLYVPKGSLQAYQTAEEWNDSFISYNEEDEQTGVTSAAVAKQVKSVVYYNTAGLQSAEPFTGVNIVVTTYTDGTKNTAKLLK